MKSILPHAGLILKITGLSVFLPAFAALFLGESSSLYSLFFTGIVFLAVGFGFDGYEKREDLSFTDSCRLVLSAYLLVGVLRIVLPVRLFAVRLCFRVCKRLVDDRTIHGHNLSFDALGAEVRPHGLDGSGQARGFYCPGCFGRLGGRKFMNQFGG